LKPGPEKWEAAKFVVCVKFSNLIMAVGWSGW
jgi:hypothetical protein